jgi:hypothetical protein
MTAPTGGITWRVWLFAAVVLAVIVGMVDEQHQVRGLRKG